MKNEKLVWKALEILDKRARYCMKHNRTETGIAYVIAHSILFSALEGDEKKLQLLTLEERDSEK